MSDDHDTVPLNIKKFVRDELIQQNQDLQKILNQFSQQTATLESKFNLIWNAINAVVRVLYTKNLVDNASVETAGRELMEEAKKNIQYLKATQTVGGTYDKAKIIPSSIDEAIDATARGMKA